MLYRNNIMKHFVAEWDLSGVQKPKKNESLEPQWNLSAQLPKLAKIQPHRVNVSEEQNASWAEVNRLRPDPVLAIRPFLSLVFMLIAPGEFSPAAGPIFSIYYKN